MGIVRGPHTMKKEKVDAAAEVCRLFLKRVDEWNEAKRPKKYWGSEEEYIPTAPKENAALHRASMELTRALADMRKPN